MNRRTFLKAVGASLAGCMLPAVPGPGVRLSNKSNGSVIEGQLSPNGVRGVRGESSIYTIYDYDEFRRIDGDVVSLIAHCERKWIVRKKDPENE